MRAAGTRTAVELLDQVYSLSQLESLEIPLVVERLAEELASCSAEQRDECMRAALSAVDALTSRAMRIRLNHALANDTTVPPQFRTYLAAQVFEFEGDLDRLRARARQVVRDDDAVTAIASAAQQVLATRAALRDGILALIPAEPETPPEPTPEREPHFFENLELD